MLTLSPGSVFLYAPGKLTNGPGVPLPPPVTLSCAHEMYSCAPLTWLAPCSAMCSMRSRYSPLGVFLGMVTGKEAWLSEAHESWPPEDVAFSA